MNSQDQAAEVISDLFHDAFHNHKGLGKDIAHALHNAGLLAPDPLQLFFEKGNGPNWEIPINDQGGGVATVRCLIGEVFIERHGHGFITSPAEAKQLAAALLAAANHQEEA